MNRKYSALEAEPIVTAALKAALEPLPFVYALWLEGSFAAGTADAYSDADYWVDVADDRVEEMLQHVEDALRKIGTLDQISDSGSDNPLLGQKVYHLAEHDRFFVIDFNWQPHSRDRNSYAYLHNDTVEAARPIFDKDAVVHYREMTQDELARKRQKAMERSAYLLGERARVEKYILRREFPEALEHYQHYVLEPLVLLLRCRATPFYPDYGFCHISRHLPKNEAERLAELMKISSFAEMEEKIREADRWIAELTENQ